MSFEFQEAGAEFLASGGHLLADEAGLGKSRQALLAAQQMGARTILVQCPAIAVGVWLAEAARWRPDLRATSVREALKTGKVPRTDRLLVASYDHVVASRELLEKLGALSHDLLICDEAHQLKTPTAKRTLLTYGALCAAGPDSLAARVGAVKVMTATPMLNHPGELFSHVRALDPGRLDGTLSYDAFTRRYCVFKTRAVRTRGGRVKNIEVIAGANRAHLPELRDRLRGFSLRRTVEQVLGDLPPLRVAHRTLPIESLDASALAKIEKSDEARELRAAIASGDPDALRHLEGHLSRLRKLVAAAKAPAVAEWALGCLDAGESKVAVWGWHTEALETVRAILAGADVKTVKVDGSTSDRARRLYVDGFNAPRGPRAGVFQIQAAGTALTMTACRRALFAEQAWTPALNYQSMKRHHRIGQRSAVLVEVLAAPGLDESVQRVLATKAADIAAMEE